MDGIKHKLVYSYPTISMLIVMLSGFCIFSLAQIQPIDSYSSAGDLKETYESRKMQLVFLLQQNPQSDSMLYYFRTEAEYFASKEDYEVALDLLNQALSLLQHNFPTSDSNSELSIDPPSLANNAPYQFVNNRQWTVEFGTDYSRQEYEMSFIESDSVILEQLSNPYASFRFSGNGRFEKQNYQIFTYFRGDQELLQSSISLALESPDYSRQWRLEAQSDIFWQHQEARGSFWDNQMRAFWSRPLGKTNRFSFNSQIRYKLNFPADSSYGNILSSELNFAVRHYIKLLSWFEFTVRPSFYNESQNLGLRYSQLQLRLDYYYRSDFNRYLQLQTNYYFRDFCSEQLTGDYQNKFNSLHPLLEIELPIINPLGFQSRIEWESRWHGSPDVTYSNYFTGSFSNQLKIYFSDYNSIGIGYVYQFEEHFTDVESDKRLVEQENFTARGMVLSLDLFKMNGLMLSLSYQFTFRDYPNAGVEDLLGFYSNRRIHSIQGFGYIPVDRHWQFQFFANYDNDRDRDREANDNFSTIFNIGLLYKF